ncbi:MAG: ROK family protein [Polyangiaceae bacterium]|nr:ROK family protein [Polyangiaceae bacterium]
METLSLGIDLGGTKIECAVLRSRGGAAPVVEHRERVATPREEGYDAIVAATAALARATARAAGREVGAIAVGVGMPGGVRRRDGLVKNSNTTCLNGRPFRADLEAALGREILFDNDANCFALAETRLGAARGHEQGVVFGVILGTGVGGGLVVRGQVWPGLHGIAGEWGHHGVQSSSPDARPCYCGQRGCLEAYASGPALEADYLTRSGRPARAPEIARLAREGDRDATAAMASLLDAFARGLANVIDVVDPSAVVLGGGVSNLSALYEEGRRLVAARVFNDELLTPILKHELGDSAGVLGAALLPLGG